MSLDELITETWLMDWLMNLLDFWVVCLKANICGHFMEDQPNEPLRVHCMKFLSLSACMVSCLADCTHCIHTAYTDCPVLNTSISKAPESQFQVMAYPQTSYKQIYVCVGCECMPGKSHSKVFSKFKGHSSWAYNTQHLHYMMSQKMLFTVCFLN